MLNWQVGSMELERGIHRIVAHGGLAFGLEPDQPESIWHVFDLDPAKPQMLSTFRLAGFAKYLHPLGAGKFLAWAHMAIRGVLRVTRPRRC